MELNDARKLFAEIRAELNLPTAWVFKFDSCHRRFGVCRYRQQVIGMSKHLVLLNTAERVGQTMRHEIAHALVGPEHGHDHVWKAMAIKCGDDGERCYSEKDTVTPEAPWIATCPKCGVVHKKRMQPRARGPRSCSFCSRRFDPNAILNFTMNPNYGRRSVSTVNPIVVPVSAVFTPYVKPTPKPVVTAAVVSTIREMRAQGHGYIRHRCVLRVGWQRLVLLESREGLRHSERLKAAMGNWLSVIPKRCEVCRKSLEGKHFIDGRTVGGWWALMCSTCHTLYGCGLGIGRGQKYDPKGKGAA